MTRDELEKLEKAVTEKKKALSGAKIEVNGSSGIIMTTGTGNGK
jgi:hypothetical protein